MIEMEYKKEINKIIKQIKEKYKPERIILFGSFGREEPEFTWEKKDKVNLIRNLSKKNSRAKISKGRNY